MNDKHTCPRRAESGTDRADSPLVGSGPDQDEWRAGHGLRDQARGCTYCGSMHPDDFMQAVLDGTKIGPTVKSYKAYVGESEGKFYFQHLSEQQRHDFLDLLNLHSINIGYPGRFNVLPFFIGRA